MAKGSGSLARAMKWVAQVPVPSASAETATERAAVKRWRDDTPRARSSATYAAKTAMAIEAAHRSARNLHSTNVSSIELSGSPWFGAYRPARHGLDARPDAWP